MIQVLDTTNKSIQLKEVANGGSLQFTAAWADITATSLTEASFSGTGNSAPNGDAVIVSAPAANVRRVVKSITIHNSNSSLSCSFIVIFKDSTDERIIARGTLAAGATWYSDTATITSVTPDAANQTITPTTANQTAAVNTRYFANISGLTATRNFVLPAGAIGDQIELTITTGSSQFEFVIIGSSGISINNAAPATEWSRLFITGESVTLVASSATNWQVVADGRIPTQARMHYSGAQISIVSSAITVATLNTVKFDNTPQAETTLTGGIGPTATTINVASTAAFRSAGGILIGTESISYTGKTATSFTGCVRGFAGTTAASQSSGAKVTQSVLCSITTSRIIPRRTNKYLITSGYRWATFPANASRAILWIENPLVVPPETVQQIEVSALAGCIPNLALATTAECIGGDYLEAWIFQNTGFNVLSNSIKEIIHLEIAEVL